ncbi:rod shape-determining protein MreC [Acidihalobacter yilgarnensis]|uniref:Cell shape-determining protein MreC n=1 Tax=Acidihalobacter yilgarnensis TaxID=2819280 RepID=A0A1D8IKF0_9GAMM|nr:rod shape-determining protein MreC [Acidihalobacter yilgarnensis]
MLLVALSIALMTADQRLTVLSEARSTLEYVVYPLQLLASLPNRAGHWLGEAFSSHTQLIDSNRELQRNNLLLKARLQKYQALASENAHLRQLLNASEHTTEKVKIARLVSIDLDPYSQRELINQGSRDGVYQGQPVIDAGGLMGQVIQVGPFNAQVLLIADPSSAVPVIDTRSGLRLLAIGTGQPDALDVRSAPVNADIRVGDLLSTSGLGERFPPHYPVCRVTQVNREPGDPFAKVLCQPTAQLDRYREVLLLWYHPPHKPVLDETPHTDTSPHGKRK